MCNVEDRTRARGEGRRLGKASKENERDMQRNGVANEASASLPETHRHTQSNGTHESGAGSDE